MPRLPRRMRFSRCDRCGQIFMLPALEIGLCWMCSGKRRPPACLKDKPEDVEPADLPADVAEATMEPDPDPFTPSTDEPPKGDYFERVD